MRGTWIAIVATVALVATAVGYGQDRRRPIRGRASAPRGAATHLLHPGDFSYLGAFRLPGPSGGSNWSYSGYAMAYSPNGDPDGPADDHPGSLFVVGHDHHQMISEVSIPAPVEPAAGDASLLEMARTLQAFREITGGMFGELEIPRAGLAVLPPQGEQTTPKLHYCWGQHFQDFASSHGWCDLDLSDPRATGPWYFGAYTNYVSNDYLFPIPSEWAQVNTPGRLLASGRFRDGLWAGRGPALFAYGPWNGGNPPAPGQRIDSITPLLLYGVPQPGISEIGISDSMAMRGFNEPDEWSGGAWLTANGRSTVVFVGTKATGRSWYGYANGVEYPIDSNDTPDDYPEVPEWPYDDRGYWSEGIEAQIIFFDPDELAAVARGDMETWEPQPYATLSIDQWLFDPGFDLERGKRYLVGAAAFDRENGILYVVERLADEEEKSLIHVWRIGLP